MKLNEHKVEVEKNNSEAETSRGTVGESCVEIHLVLALLLYRDVHRGGQIRADCGSELHGRELLHNTAVLKWHESSRRMHAMTGCLRLAKRNPSSSPQRLCIRGQQSGILFDQSRHGLAQKRIGCRPAFPELDQSLFGAP